jgi:hypothetical protein
LIRTFRHAVYALYNIPTTSLLALGLSAGLASLKLPACYDQTQRNVDCPVCDTDGLGILAKEVPWSHHVNSVIVCRITGKIMDEDNPPLCLPNGQVYSQRVGELSPYDYSLFSPVPGAERPSKPERGTSYLSQNRGGFCVHAGAEDVYFVIGIIFSLFHTLYYCTVSIRSPLSTGLEAQVSSSSK